MLLGAFFISFSFLNGQCDESEVELWGNCYSIESTYELNLSEQDIGGVIPEEISNLQNLLFLDLSNTLNVRLFYLMQSKMHPLKTSITWMVLEH